MKRAALFLALMGIPMLALAGDFEISIDRKKDHEGQSTGNIEQKSTQKWVGVIKIKNRSFKPTPPVEVKYMLIVKRQELAQKLGADQIDKVKGNAKVAALKPGESTSVATSEVQLNHQKLAGNYYFSNGGATKAEDAVIGIWIKIFNGTTEEGEYINPTSMTAKYKWEP